MREPRYTELDRAELLALTQHQASLCPGGCGQPLDESTAHHETGPDYDTGSTSCRACSILAATQRADTERKTADPARLYHVIRIGKGAS